jgi:hypothetical protein
MARHLLLYEGFSPNIIFYIFEVNDDKIVSKYRGLSILAGS